MDTEVYPAFCEVLDCRWGALGSGNLALDELACILLAGARIFREPLDGDFLGFLGGIFDNCCIQKARGS